MSQEEIVANYEKFITISGITTVDETTVKLSVNVPFEDFEDAMQHYSALADGADLIITRNKSDFTKTQIPVLEPQEFLYLITQ